MRTFDMSLLAENVGFSGAVRISDGLISDSMFATQSCVVAFGIRPVERLELLLEDVATQLARYPAGTQAVRLTHFRIPPGGNESEPLLLELEAIVVQGDQEHGDYLLLAQIEELSHTAVMSAAA